MVEKLKPTEARQGRLGKPVLFVLIGGLVLAVIALFVFVAGTDVQNPPPDIGVVDNPRNESPAPAR